MIVPGSRVLIHYALTVDGVVVDRSLAREPLAYVQRDGTLVPGAEPGKSAA
jgi:FKBP-type peptidyl-prolyl cis-trans isomerase 2